MPKKRIILNSVISVKQLYQGVCLMLIKDEIWLKVRTQVYGQQFWFIKDGSSGQTQENIFNLDVKSLVVE